MVDLRPAYKEAVRNIGTWRNKYPSDIYPHKIVLNMMYRAYTTKFVFEAFREGELLSCFDTFDEASRYVMEIYGQTAITTVHQNLERWMRTQPYEQVGTLCTANYEKLASEAETDSVKLEELEFSYMFELLNDMSVLYWIAFCLTGESEDTAYGRMMYAVPDIPRADYTMSKQVFQQLLVAKFMSQNYRPF